MPGLFFGKGFKLEGKKISEDCELRRIHLPERLFVHLRQHIGVECRPLVRKGDAVKRFQKIAESGSYVSAPIHAPADGTVEAIAEHPHPSSGMSPAIVIRTAGKYEEPVLEERKDAVRLSSDKIIAAARDCGIVGMGGAMFPTHVKLKIPEKARVDTLIINGAECEPFLTSDHRLMVEKPDSIIKGIRLMMRATGAGKCLVGIEKNKVEAVSVMLDHTLGVPDIEVVPIRPFYPAGAEKMLIKALTGREVPQGRLPFDAGVVVSNVGTAFALYEAVYLSKPLVERVVTVTGDVQVPSNLIAYIGTEYQHLVGEAGGYSGQPSKIICGGPMMGIAQHSERSSLIKGNNGVIVFNGSRKKELMQYEEDECIRCAKCVDVCPAGIMPTNIAKFSKKKKFGFAGLENALDCFECGCCSYACPSRIDLVGWIKKAKSELCRKNAK